MLMLMLTMLTMTMLYMPRAVARVEVHVHVRYDDACEGLVHGEEGGVEGGELSVWCGTYVSNRNRNRNHERNLIVVQLEPVNGWLAGPCGVSGQWRVLSSLRASRVWCVM